MRNFEIIRLNPLLQILTLIGFIFIGIIIFQLIFSVVLLGLFSLSPDQISSINDIPPVPAKIMVIFNQVGMFLFPALLFSYFYQKNLSLLNFYQAKNSFQTKRILVFLIFIPVSILSVDLFEFLNGQLIQLLPENLIEILKDSRSDSEETLIHLLTGDRWGEILLQIFTIAFIPALAEELFFRGVLMRLFYKYTGNIHAAIITVALLFAALHFQFHYIIPMWFMGIILGYTYYWTGSIVFPFLLHFINNILAVVFFHSGITEIQTQNTIIIIIPIMLPGLIFLFAKLRNKDTLNSWYRN